MPLLWLLEQWWGSRWVGPPLESTTLPLMRRIIQRRWRVWRRNDLPATRRGISSTGTRRSTSWARDLETIASIRTRPVNWTRDACVYCVTKREVKQKFFTCKRGSAAVVRTTCCYYGKGQILYLSRAETPIPVNTKFLFLCRFLVMLDWQVTRWRIVLQKLPCSCQCLA